MQTIKFQKEKEFFLSLWHRKLWEQGGNKKKVKNLGEKRKK